METEELEKDINAVYQAIKSSYDSVEEAYEAAKLAVSILATRWDQKAVLYELSLFESKS